MSKFSTRTQRLCAVMLAALSSVIVWVVAEVVVGIDLRGSTHGSSETFDIGAGMVAATGFGVALAGWVLLAGLERYTRRAGQIWTWTAAVVWLASFSGPFAAPDITTATMGWLAAMHAVVGAVLIPLLSRTAAPAVSRERLDRSPRPTDRTPSPR